MKRRIFYTPFAIFEEKKFSSLKRHKEYLQVKNRRNRLIFRKTVFYKQVLDFHRHSTGPCLLLYAASNRFHIWKVGHPAKAGRLQKLYSLHNFSYSWAKKVTFWSYSTTILTIYPSSVGKAFWFFSSLDVQQEEYARSAKPGIENRLAFQQASAIHTMHRTEQCCTLPTDLHNILWS
jgi:hypothetical protein